MSYSFPVSTLLSITSITIVISITIVSHSLYSFKKMNLNSVYSFMSGFLLNDIFWRSPKVHLLVVEVFFYCCVVSLFTKVPVYRHLGYFQCLAIMSKIAVNIHVFGEYINSFLSSVHQGVELLGHRVGRYMFICSRYCQFSKVIESVYTLINND